MMTVKEVRRLYKGYELLAFGRPLNESTIPFTCLPKGKELDDCEVIDCKIIEKEFYECSIDFKSFKTTKDKLKKGFVHVYIK